MWKNLETIQQLDSIDELSKSKPQLLFKHSTRCNVSEDAYHELQSGEIELWYLDLITFREVSNEIASRYNVVHKSPQVLVIVDGKCVYNESHWNIKSEKVKGFLR